MSELPNSDLDVMKFLVAGKVLLEHDGTLWHIEDGKLECAKYHGFVPTYPGEFPHWSDIKEIREWK